LEVRIMSLLNSTKMSARRAQVSLAAAILVLLAPCVVAARYAFTFDLDRQEAANVQEKQEQAQQERKKLEELKRQTRDLKEKLQSVDESQRGEVEARLLEAEKILEEHQRAMKDTLRQQAEAEKLRAAADATVERASEALKLKEQLARLETQSPRNENELREVRERLKELLAETQQNRKVKVIYRVEPEYTADAREKQIEGTVVLGVTIDHEGVPQNIQIKKPLFPSLDNAAVEALSKWRFEPALKDGQPASMYITVEFVFSPSAMESKLKGKEERIQREQEEREGAMKTEADGAVFKTKRDKERDEQEQAERTRRQSELTRDAVIPMDRAIQIATSQVPGKVLACSLGRDGSMVFYHVVIISGEGDQSAATYLWISAADGHVLKTEKEKRPRTF
jgi:TonB family protein